MPKSNYSKFDSGGGVPGYGKPMKSGNSGSIRTKSGYGGKVTAGKVRTKKTRVK